jgi:hypothetical protein
MFDVKKFETTYHYKLPFNSKDGEVIFGLGPQGTTPGPCYPWHRLNVFSSFYLFYFFSDFNTKDLKKTQNKAK